MARNTGNHGVTLAVAGGLALLWGGIRGYALLSGHATAPPDALAPGGLSLAASAVLALAAWWAAARWGQAVGRRLAVGVALGMSCGFLGDLALTQWILDGRPSFLAALVAFGAGHTSYFVALRSRLEARPATFPAAVLSWPLTALAGWHAVIWNAETPLGGYVWPILVYALALSAVAAKAAALATQDRRFLPAALGATAFLVSDFWIGLTLFNPGAAQVVHDALGLDVVWLTYGPAQFLIVHTIALLALTAQKADLSSVAEVRLDVAG